MPARKKRSTITKTSRGKTLTRTTASSGRSTFVGAGWLNLMPPAARSPFKQYFRNRKGRFVAKPKPPRVKKITKPLKVTKPKIIKPKSRIKPTVQTYKQKRQMPTRIKPPVQTYKTKTVRPTTGAAARQRRGLVERGKTARIQVQNYKAQKLIKIQKGINKASGRAWRGPPGALGDDVIVEILPTVDLAMDAAGVNTGTKIDWKALWNSINQFYLDVVMYLKDYIGRPLPRQEGVVPTDTGKLRRKMWQSLERQWYSKTKMPMTAGHLKKAAENGDPLLMVVLNTGNLMYAKPVNAMPTSMLAHPHAGSSNAGKGGPLWDPYALGGWYDKVLLNGRNRAQAVNHLLQPLLGNRPKLLEVFYK